MLEKFFSMGGFAFYVWSAYGIVLIVMFMNIFNAYKSQRLSHKHLRERQELISQLSAAKPAEVDGFVED